MKRILGSVDTLVLSVIVTSLVPSWLCLAVCVIRGFEVSDWREWPLALLVAGEAVYGDITTSMFAFGLGLITYWVATSSLSFDERLGILFLGSFVLLVIQVGLIAMLKTRWSYIGIEGLLLCWWLVPTVCVLTLFAIWSRLLAVPLSLQTSHFSLRRAIAVCVGTTLGVLVLWAVRDRMVSSIASSWAAEETVYEVIHYALSETTRPALLVFLACLSLIVSGVSTGILYPVSTPMEVRWSIIASVGVLALPLTVSVANPRSLWVTWLLRLFVVGCAIFAVWAGVFLHRLYWLWRHGKQAGS